MNVTHSKTVRFMTFLAPEMYGVYEEAVRYVGRQLGLPATLSVGAHDYDVFEHGEADFGYI